MNRLPSHLRHKAAGPHGFSRAANGLLLRAVVLETHLPGANLAYQNPDQQSGSTGVTCDVYVYDRRHRSVLRGVPILLDSAGLNDHEVWKPRPTSVDLRRGLLVVSPEQQGGRPTQASDMDGDHVVIGFLANDLDQPVIRGQIPHPRNRRRPLVGDSDTSEFKYRRFIRGSAFGVRDDGNIDIDLSQANSGEITPVGAETPDPTSGNMAIKLYGGALGTAARLSVLSATGSSPEPVLKGDTFLTDLDGHLDDLNGFLGKLSAGLSELSSALGGFGILTPNNLMTVAEITVFQANIAALKASIAVSQASGAPYLSVHLETD